MGPKSTHHMSPTVVVVIALVMAVVVWVAVLGRTAKPDLHETAPIASRAGAADRLSDSPR